MDCNSEDVQTVPVANSQSDSRFYAPSTSFTEVVQMRTRLTLTRLEERETPSVSGPVDPTGAPINPTPPSAPAQTSPSDPTVDPYSSP